MENNKEAIPANESVTTTSLSTDIRELNDIIQKESAFLDLLNLEIKKVIVGQQHMIDSLMIGLLSNGHILLEGVPDLQKPLLSVHFLKPLMLILKEFNLRLIFFLQIYLEL